MRTVRFNPVPFTLAAALAGTFVSTLALPANAQSGASTPGALALSMPAQPLAQSLNEVARLANLQMSFPAALVAGKTAPAVSGRLSARQAVDRLLAGSGLEATVDGSSVLVRQAAPASAGNRTLPVVEVTESATRSPAPYAGGQVARGGRIGLLGDKDMLDTPFSATQYTAQLIEDQQAQNLGDVLVNDPSVRNTYSRGAGRDEFNIRGFTLFNYDVSFNGLYGISPRNASSLIGVERVEVLRGPNALLNGMAPAGSVGGAINLVPKRADTEPLNRVTLSYVDDGQFGTQVDIGRRFGEDKEWGVRVNALKRSGDTPVDHSSENLGALTLGVDYQGDRVRLEADLGYQDRLTRARSGLLFPPESGTAIGRAPDAKTNFLPEWTYWKAKELSAMVRAEVDVAPGWTAFGAIGAMRYDFRSLQTSWLLQDSDGTIAGRPTRLNEQIDTETAEAGLRSKFDTGALHHEAVVSLSTLNSDQGTRRQNGSFIFSNLYQPASIARPNITTAPGIPKIGETKLRSVALADTISSSDRRIQLTLGARHQQVETAGFDASSGNRTAHYDRSAVTPVAALVVKATDQWSFYGNYIEGLSQGPTAPEGAVNAGEVFPPAKAKQIEFGTKYDFGRFATTFSVYQIERPSSFLDLTTLRFSAGGEQRNRGAEILTQGEAAKGVRLLAGLAYTDGKLVRTEGGLNDGRTAPATPKFQFNVAGEWDASLLPGLTFTARALRTSGQYVDMSNTQRLPGWTRYDLGARYRFITGNVPVTVRAAVENLLDKNYWQSAAREGLTIGAPRTFLVSVSADF
ncbi:TonB-dependent receptor [Variovorax guangxiensis]|uniref:TonB-dependent receptor n=1 Tax=Variovorax guangxiensis TaxID=1775474 RepID=A0A502DTB7_9BURK|nr:TonB-dependent receptor [Variovorax guangxiensis]TPG24398.1 TonB-dependent receptor [Variovorax ginsengisoli]TPG28648.1 TonB-dependent receptor [Variovorax guangxiensis]